MTAKLYVYIPIVHSAANVESVTNNFDMSDAHDILTSYPSDVFASLEGAQAHAVAEAESLFEPDEAQLPLEPLLGPWTTEQEGRWEAEVLPEEFDYDGAKSYLIVQRVEVKP